MRTSHKHTVRSSPPLTVVETLAHLFPRDTAAFREQAELFLESRIWGGIHFRDDVVIGEALGQAVADKVIERAQQDGSQ